jgi:hypothetical protein
MPARTIQVTLTVADIQVLLDGLDSHVYWDLSDDDCRSSGFVVGDGSSVPEHPAEIRRVRALMDRLEAACRGAGVPALLRGCAPRRIVLGERCCTPTARRRGALQAARPLLDVPIAPRRRPDAVPTRVATPGRR